MSELLFYRGGDNGKEGGATPDRFGGLELSLNDLAGGGPLKNFYRGFPFFEDPFVNDEV
jgi:hypothetical protein